MTMKIDGPTLNEMSSIDSTGSVEQGGSQRIATTRPVSISTKIRMWFNDSWKQFLIGVAIAAATFILGNLIIHHNIHLTEHDKDIEYLQKNDDKQDGEIKQLKEKTNEMNTDLRLMEQRMELEKSSQTKKNQK